MNQSEANATTCCRRQAREFTKSIPTTVDCNAVHALPEQFANQLTDIDTVELNFTPFKFLKRLFIEAG